MEQNRVLAVVGVIVVLVLAIILGTLFYLNKTFQKNTPRKVATTTPSPTLTTFPVSTPSPSAASTTAGTSAQAPSTSGSSSSVTVEGDLKVYNGPGFQVKYPKNWGLLTCDNSQNFELNPASSADNPNYACNYAIEPVTILVAKNDCSGVNENINGINVIKSVKTYSNGGIDYDWCTQTTPALHISHRVDPNGGTATSTTDYSYQVEQMISTLSFGGGS